MADLKIFAACEAYVSTLHTPQRPPLQIPFRICIGEAFVVLRSQILIKAIPRVPFVEVGALLAVFRQFCVSSPVGLTGPSAVPEGAVFVSEKVLLSPCVSPHAPRKIRHGLVGLGRLA